MVSGVVVAVVVGKPEGERRKDVKETGRSGLTTITGLEIVGSEVLSETGGELSWVRNGIGCWGS